ncbi:uncharacterized protein LOC127778387 isoform X2 [Oryza glaberrima]|uniref:uncharacterized protein LOC127778387 isoform X2 n=1 Tax=Oryza glaberrima TaxID=4538 RepID=UPI00224C4378|nr:uncharacterized protein LOC127778387 isoform X2 [Oryza glaberrima]
MAAARVLSKRLTPGLFLAGAAEVGIRALHHVSTGAIRLPNNQGLHAFPARSGMTLMKNNPLKPPFSDSINGAKRPFSSKSTKNDNHFPSSENSLCSCIFLFTNMTFILSMLMVRERQRDI